MTEKCCPHSGKRMQPPPLAGVEKELVDALLERMARPADVIERVVAGDKFIAVVAEADLPTPQAAARRFSPMGGFS